MAKAFEPQGFIITPDQLVDRIAPLARLAIDWQKDLTQINLMGGVAWGQRERLRTVQGLFKKIEDECNEIIWSEGNDYAVDIAEAIWGAVDLEV